MKSLPNGSAASATSAASVDNTPARSRRRRRLREVLAQFRRDVRDPLPGDAERSFFARVGARTRHLLRKHGWKLFWAIVIFYFIRDLLLYVILPYFLARSLLG